MLFSYVFMLTLNNSDRFCKRYLSKGLYFQSSETSKLICAVNQWSDFYDGNRVQNERPVIRENGWELKRTGDENFNIERKRNDGNELKMKEIYINRK